MVSITMADKLNIPVTTAPLLDNFVVERETGSDEAMLLQEPNGSLWFSVPVELHGVVGEQKQQRCRVRVLVGDATDLSHGFSLPASKNTPPAVRVARELSQSRRRLHKRSAWTSAIEEGHSLNPNESWETADSVHEDIACVWTTVDSVEIPELKKTFTDFLNLAQNVFEKHPELAEAERALETQLAKVVKTNNSFVDNDYIDALSALPPKPESLQALLGREARARQALAERCELLDMKAFATLAAGQINASVKNLAATFSRLRKQNAILAVDWLGKTLYPAIQINRKTLQIFAELPDLLRDAYHHGYTEWEVLEWLVSNQSVPTSQLYAGAPLPHTSPEDLLRQVEAKVYPLEDGDTFRPIDLLQQGQTGLFDQLKSQWLGE